MYIYIYNMYKDYRYTPIPQGFPGITDASCHNKNHMFFSKMVPQFVGVQLVQQLIVL